MRLTEKQNKIYEGLICPYCGRETELADADKIYKTKGLGMVRLCRSCFAWVGVYTSGPNKGVAKGRLANASLRGLKVKMHAEFDRLHNNQEERAEVYRTLSGFMGLPLEYTHIGMFSEKSAGKLFDFCIENKNKTGSNILKKKSGCKCEARNNRIEVGSSACHGCPEFLFHSQNGDVYCDKDMSYGHIKQI